jgi:hypothetical protein
VDMYVLIAAIAAAVIGYQGWLIVRTSPVAGHDGATDVQSRLKASLLTAAAFAGFTAILALSSDVVPFAWMVVVPAIYAASPFTWGWTLMSGLDAPWAVQRSLLPLAFLAPFPIVGFAVGYLWPFRYRSWWQVLRAAGLRFAVTFISLGCIGAAVLLLILHR